MIRATPAAAFAATLLLAAAPSPARADDEGDKRAALALMEDGIALLKKSDFAGALDLFQRAYDTYPSAKLFVNLGTALKGMGRDAEAANYYQRAINEANLGDSRVSEIEKTLAGLDKKLGQITITVTPDDAEIKIGDGDWLSPASLSRWRVTPGTVQIEARKLGYLSGFASEQVAARATVAISIDLELDHPDEVVDPDTVITDPPPGGKGPDGPVIGGSTTRPRGSRLGASARALIDGKGRGGAGAIGALLSLGDRVDLEAAAILGPSLGGYVGAAFAVTGGRLRPRLAVGAPVYMSDGPRWALRGAGGVEWRASAHLSLVVELGVEYMLNPEDDIDTLQMVPVIGAQGRL